MRHACRTCCLRTQKVVLQLHEMLERERARFTCSSDAAAEEQDRSFHHKLLQWLDHDETVQGSREEDGAKGLLHLKKLLEMLRRDGLCHRSNLGINDPTCYDDLVGEDVATTAAEYASILATVLAAGPNGLPSCPVHKQRPKKKKKSMTGCAEEATAHAVIGWRVKPSEEGRLKVGCGEGQRKLVRHQEGDGAEVIVRC